jgi:hypothetical protein
MVRCIFTSTWSTGAEAVGWYVQVGISVSPGLRDRVLGSNGVNPGYLKIRNSIKNKI